MVPKIQAQIKAEERSTQLTEAGSAPLGSVVGELAPLRERCNHCLARLLGSLCDIVGSEQ